MPGQQSVQCSAYDPVHAMPLRMRMRIRMRSMRVLTLGGTSYHYQR